MSEIDFDLWAWEAWRPERVASLLADVAAPWYVAAGWAIELFVPGYRREHEDLEIAASNERFDEIAAALDGLEIFVITGPGRACPLADAADRLEETHQTWVREPEAGRWRFDVLREPSADGDWVCRRDPRIRLPYDDVIAWTDEGIPYGRPEIVLLFKAKHARPKDDADLAAALPLLEPSARRWLAQALELVHPGHRWLAELA